MKQRLGKGLGALLPDMAPEEVSGAAVRDLPITQVDPDPAQPRKHFDEEALRQLADSLKLHGMIQPIVVRPEGPEHYVIVAGERRYRAARLLGLSTIPAIVRDFEKRAAIEAALVENLQRQDLNPIEEAAAIEAYMGTFDLTQEEAAANLGKSRPALTNSLRLLKLPDDLQERVIAGALTAGHARALLSVESDDLRRELAAVMEAQDLSVRQSEALIKKVTREKAKPKKTSALPAEFEDFAQTLREKLGTKVTVNGTLKRGRIVIDYYSRDDLDRIYEFFDRQ